LPATTSIPAQRLVVEVTEMVAIVIIELVRTPTDQLVVRALVDVARGLGSETRSACRR
jgi:hypothetical protein